MQKSILKFQIFSAIFAIILGVILHFVFEWSGDNAIVGAVSAVNESTWEHLKLAFYPMLITTVIGYFYLGKEVPNFLCAKTIGVFSTILCITILFYSYTGILGTNYAFANIALFIISVILGEFFAYKIMKSNFGCNKIISAISLVILLISFIVFTYFSPKIGLFKDPTTNDYGISKNFPRI